VIQSREDLRRYLATDLEMNGLLPRWSPRYRLTRRTVYFQRLLRRSEYWANCRGDPLGRAVSAVLNARLILLGERMGMSLPRNVFGPGLSIAHSGLLVANADARVGARCRIHHGVTLAGADGQAPSIGDDVFIGPNVVVVGGVSVGDGAVLLAGSVVTADVPAGATVAGVPAKVTRTHTPLWHKTIYPLTFDRSEDPGAGLVDASNRSTA
jgi:serine O-acetyltransferase